MRHRRWTDTSYRLLLIKAVAAAAAAAAAAAYAAAAYAAAAAADDAACAAAYDACSSGPICGVHTPEREETLAQQSPPKNLDIYCPAADV